MTWTTSDVPVLSGRTAIVTGGNSGIGFQAARVLARKGADVVLACRNPAKGTEALRTIVAESPHALVEVWDLDLASLASVRSFAARVLEQKKELALLINNAGVMAIPRALTRDGFEMQLGVNHFGHFALTGLLLERLLATPGTRVVNVSSRASEIGKMRWDDLDGARHYEKWSAYGQSKLANLLFTFELAERLEKHGAQLRAVACHPGYAATNLQSVGPTLAGSQLSALVMRVGNSLFAQSAEAGAWPTLFAATDASAKNGDFIGPLAVFQWRGQPGHVQPRKLARNPEVRRRLWEVSVERTGVDFAQIG